MKNIDNFLNYTKKLLLTTNNSATEVAAELYSLITTSPKTIEDNYSIIKSICGKNNKKNAKLFIKDYAYGITALKDYMAKYCKNELIIASFHFEMVDMGSNLNHEEEEIPDIILSKLEDNPNRLIIKKYILKRLNKDDADTIDIDTITEYYETFLVEDFHNLKFEILCSSIITDYTSLPSDEEFKSLYDTLIDLNLEYGYEQTLKEMLESIDCTNDSNYEQFTYDEDYALEILKKYFSKYLIDPEEKEAELINYVARRYLSIFIYQNTPKDNKISIYDVLDYYFMNLKDINPDIFKTLPEYGLNLKQLQKVQKISLISDYYNYNSDIVFSPEYIDKIKSNKELSEYNKMAQSYISFIKSHTTEELIHQFDNDYIFRHACIVTYVSSMSYEYNVCSDTDTLRRINPYFVLEQLTNRNYQKIKK